MIIDRQYYNDLISQSFLSNPIVAILGPRQCGKTTLAMHYANSNQNGALPAENIFDLERMSDFLRLKDPEFTLGQLIGLVVIDEVQRMPELFNHLRVLVDRPTLKTRFLILGSASRVLIQHTADSLAGRISYIELTPLSLFETQDPKLLFLRGGYPKSYLAPNNSISINWLQNYIKTYLEQDLPQLGIQVQPQNLRRFWLMLSHYHGQIFNASELGRSLSISYHTVEKYLDILTQTFMIRRLVPWFENIKKRQVKAPKIYFRDTGVLLNLLGIEDESALLTHPKLGAAWEGFALEQTIQTLHADPEQCFYWATHSDAEIDLVIFYKTKRLGFEFKYGSSVQVTRSMITAAELLKLDHVFVVHAGDRSYPLAPGVSAVALSKMTNAQLLNNM